ncbi:hypothetical protein KM043_001964 [Ampulex compressa]|nr:hypothetical protein KM043_001964 [Ampulex compressa]
MHDSNGFASVPPFEVYGPTLLITATTYRRLRRAKINGPPNLHARRYQARAVQINYREEKPNDRRYSQLRYSTPSFRPPRGPASSEEREKTNRTRRAFLRPLEEDEIYREGPGRSSKTEA